MNAGGSTTLSFVDNEFRWIKTYFFNPMRTSNLVTPEADPESLTTLFSTGFDDYDFQTELTFQGEVVRGRRIEGFDRLTGISVEIDGVQLQSTEFAVTETDMTTGEITEIFGSQYVSETYRSFLPGVTTIVGSEGTHQIDRTPVEFIHPDEPGFLSSSPVYECDDALMSRVPDVPETENNHDHL